MKILLIAAVIVFVLFLPALTISVFIWLMGKYQGSMASEKDLF